MSNKVLELDGRTVETMRRDKVFWPDSGFTKGDLLDYYARIADEMLPHLRGRPLTLQRFPDGIDADGFYQKRAQDYFPDWLPRVTVDSSDGEMTYVTVEAAADLVYLADQGTITFHRWLSRAEDEFHPDLLVFDLDPPGDDFAEVRFAAKAVRERGEDVFGEARVMTTGSSGLHVIFDLDGRADFDEARERARNFAEQLEEEYPDRLTTAQRKAKRKGRVYLDVGRNAHGQTAVAPYSVRARPGAPVATPIRWDEVDSDLTPDGWTITNLFRRLGQIDDPWG